MKKLGVIIVSCFVALAIHAQAKHLKFMGIPLNGTITQFQAKLMGKGAVPDSKTNQTTPVGCRVFNGTFSGEEATIFVYYNSKTKIVYRAKAVIPGPRLEWVKDKLIYYKKLLNEKYIYGEGDDYEQEGHPAYILYVSDDEEDYLGTIALYITDAKYGADYALHLDYEDDANTDANKSKNMDDL